MLKNLEFQVIVDSKKECANEKDNHKKIKS
jgi:hypothetical protein